MGRPFVRVSLGGVHDEAEIRGHGGPMWALCRATSSRRSGRLARDCVMMLDEIDKMGRGVQGDPSAAMLEVLDPEQNATFRDNYLGVPFDLSRVAFIATANMLDTIPGPLRDRMEIITLAGYTEDEKLQIARRYLVRRQLEANGLRPSRPRSATRPCAGSSGITPAKPASGTWSARSAGPCATPPCGSPRAAPSTCASTPGISPQSSVRSV